MNKSEEIGKYLGQLIALIIGGGLSAILIIAFYKIGLWILGLCP